MSTPIPIRTSPPALKENKFGIPIDSARAVYRRAQQLPNLNIVGVDCHIGSQLTDTAPFLDALARVLALIDELAADGIAIKHLDLGGGLGVRYRDEEPPEPDAYMRQVLSALGSRKLQLVLEPGRSIVANAGVLLTRVEYLKLNEYKNFCVIDAAMITDLIRPALYAAWMDIQPDCTNQPGAGAPLRCGRPGLRNRRLSRQGSRIERRRHGDLLAVFSAGAYGFSMSSNYNSRTRAAEVMVDGDHFYLVRARETLADRLRGESLLP